MLYTPEENLNNGEDDLFLLFKSQWGGPGPLGPPGHTPERVRSWSICALHLVPPNKYEKLHNLDFIFITFSKLINREKITGIVG